MNNVLLTGVVTLLSALAVSIAANAATFVLTNTNGGDGYATPIAGGYDLYGSDNAPIAQIQPSLTTLLAIADLSETLTYDYVYTWHDCCGSIYDPAGYLINGVQTQLSLSVNDPILPRTQTGTMTFNLSAGDTYGFYVFSTDSKEGRGEIAFTNFAGVPEPASWSLMIIGIGMAGIALRRRRSLDVAVV